MTSSPGLVPLPQFSYGGQQVLYHTGTLNYGGQQLVYHNTLPTVVSQEPSMHKGVYEYPVYPQFITPTVMPNRPTAAEMEALAYQPVNDQIVGSFLLHTTQKLWMATERMRRWCIWRALQKWKLRTIEDRILCHARRRLGDLCIALRKVRKDQQQVEQNLRKRWGHTKAALENSNAGELDKGIVDEDFRRRLRHVAFEFEARTDQHQTQIMEVREELRMNRGCLILQFLLALLKRRQVLACTLHWRDTIVLRHNPGLVDLMQLFRDPRGCPAHRWRMFGLQEQELHAELQGDFSSQKPAKYRASGAQRAGLLLLRSILEGQRHRMCAWALEKFERAAQVDDMGPMQQGDRAGLDTSFSSEPLMAASPGAQKSSLWNDAIPGDRNPLPSDRGTVAFDFSASPTSTTTPSRANIFGKVLRWDSATSPAVSSAMVEQPQVPQYNPPRVLARSSPMQSSSQIQEMRVLSNSEESVPSIPSDSEHDRPHMPGEIKGASAGPLETSQPFSDSSLDSADWIYTPVEVVSVGRPAASSGYKGHDL